jgi:hypothetical protein
MSRTRKIKKRTPSERLRGVFYNLWEKDDQGFKEFEPYYDSKMEKLITHYKQLI